MRILILALLVVGLLALVRGMGFDSSIAAVDPLEPDVVPATVEAAPADMELPPDDLRSDLLAPGP